MSEWQLIETAPKDGTIIVLSDGNFVGAGGWCPAVHGQSHPWVFMDDFNGHQPHGCCDNEDGSRIEINGFKEGGVTHWMPMPSPPTT
jgi:hypothetical protein